MGNYLEGRIQTENPEDENADEVKTLKPIGALSDQEFQDLAESILVVVAHRANEGISAGICTHFGMWSRINLRVATIKDPFGGFIECTRGGMVKLFLDFAKRNPEVKYLVMIDNDEAIEWDAPLLLANHGLPIVSGVVCSYNPERGIFACFTVKDENGIARFPSFRDTKMMPAKGVIEAEQVGTGLLCIRRDVLETMQANDEQPFFIPEESRVESVEIGNLKKSEDISFSERAERYGFKRYVDLSIHANHFKTIPVGWPQDSVDPTLDAIEWKPSPFDYPGVV